MKEFLENIAKSKNWYFEYGRSDFHNLYDNDDNSVFKMFLDPVVESDEITELGNLKSKTFEGRFLLLMKSELDGVYDTQEKTEASKGKYEMHVKPCKEEVEGLRKQITCHYQIKVWRVMEVINMLDVNADGVLVTFKIEK